MLSWLFSCGKRAGEAEKPYPLKDAKTGNSISKEVMDAFQAIKDLDEPSLALALKTGIDANSRDEKGFTLLHRTVISTSFKNQESAILLMKTLIDAKADPNLGFEGNGWYFMPLHSAVRRGLYSVSKFLAENHAQITNDNKGKIPTDYIRDEVERSEVQSLLNLSH